ncbi:MAG TPA: hypothetical protein VGR40_06245, partial [Candidatus Binatus sp.]|nr:hypothetical protein [Candidatus Binatus sp.]
MVGQVTLGVGVELGVGPDVVAVGVMPPLGVLNRGGGGIVTITASPVGIAVGDINGVSPGCGCGNCSG